VSVGDSGPSRDGVWMILMPDDGAAPLPRTGTIREETTTPNVAVERSIDRRLRIRNVALRKSRPRSQYCTIINREAERISTVADKQSRVSGRGGSGVTGLSANTVRYVDGAFGEWRAAT